MLLRNILKQILLEWGGQLENYWLNKDGKGHKVGNHTSYAQLVSKLRSGKDVPDVYEWMYKNGWARIVIENGDIYIQTTQTNADKANLTTAQKDWIQDKIYLYPKDRNGESLRPVNIYGRSINI